MADGQALSPRTDALDVIVELLGAMDGARGATGREFYDRLCEACCRVASMERAGLLLYDDARQLVVPVAAGGRWLGVIFADRGGTRFDLTDEERHAMWTLGKTAALAASVRIATSQQGRARLLQARIDLARELHERVVQRLFGVSLVLGSEHALSEEARRRCADEMHHALADLREALSRPLAPPSLDTGATLREELARLGRHYKDLPLELDWQEGVEVPEEIEPLAQSVLAEGLRNAHKHAKPSAVRVHVGRIDGAFLLEVRNDV